jgi:hypothetical protein
VNHFWEREYVRQFPANAILGFWSLTISAESAVPWLMRNVRAAGHPAMGINATF